MRLFAVKDGHRKCRCMGSLVTVFQLGMCLTQLTAERRSIELKAMEKCRLGRKGSESSFARGKAPTRFAADKASPVVVFPLGARKDQTGHHERSDWCCDGRNVLEGVEEVEMILQGDNRRRLLRLLRW